MKIQRRCKENAGRGLQNWACNAFQVVAQRSLRGIGGHGSAQSSFARERETARRSSAPDEPPSEDAFLKTSGGRLNDDRLLKGIALGCTATLQDDGGQ